MTRQKRQERAEAMFQLYQAGITNREIAQRFDVSKNVMYRAFRAYGYPVSKGRGWHGNSEAHRRNAQRDTPILGAVQTKKCA